MTARRPSSSAKLRRLDYKIADLREQYQAYARIEGRLMADERAEKARIDKALQAAYRARARAEVKARRNPRRGRRSNPGVSAPRALEGYLRMIAVNLRGAVKQIDEGVYPQYDANTRRAIAEEIRAFVRSREEQLALDLDYPVAPVHIEGLTTDHLPDTFNIGALRKARRFIQIPDGKKRNPRRSPKHRADNPKRPKRGYQIQAFLLDADSFNLKRAKAWLRKWGHRDHDVTLRGAHYVAEQFPRDDFYEETIHPTGIAKHIDAIVGKPQPETNAARASTFRKRPKVDRRQRKLPIYTPDPDLGF